MLENLALRQQLACPAQQGRRPRLTPADRCFWVALRAVWSDWPDRWQSSKPATVVAWQRRAYGAYWRRVACRPGRPRTDAHLRNLIRRMVAENHWGAPRLHGELLKLGVQVSERTASRHVRLFRPRRAPGSSWKTFLTAHRDVLTAMGFFTVPTVTFRLLYALVILQHHRRRLLHVSVTVHPTAAWVCQQLREAFPFDTAVRYVLLDRAAIFSTEVCRVLEYMEVRPVRTSVQSPWQDGVAERWVGICRRERLDHVIVLNEEHLRRLLREFVEYYHTDRTHLSLGKDSPTPRARLRAVVAGRDGRLAAACRRLAPPLRVAGRGVSMEMEFWRGTG